MGERAEGGGYGQFCPVAMAAELVCTRWTPLVLRELLAGSTRFNDIRRGVPRMSPTLLSQRLKALEQAGLVRARRRAPDAAADYRLTPAGAALRPVIEALGGWGQRWIESSLSLRHLDPSLLMWDMRRNLRPDRLPPRRWTIAFVYPELRQGRRWWLVIDGAAVDLCRTDPGWEVDLEVEGSLRSMTAVWMGHSSLRAELASGAIRLTGDRAVAGAMQRWLGLSPFAQPAAVVR